MRFAEAIWRIGCTLVGWMLAYAHCLVLAVVPLSSCEIRGDEAWWAALVMAVPTAACVLLIPLGQPMRSVLRWLALPFPLLAVLATRAVLPFLFETTLGGRAFCAVQDGGLANAEPWQQTWAPIQLTLLLALSWVGVRYWWPRQGPRQGGEATG